MNLGLRIALRISTMLAATTAIVFLSAGTWSYWQGWAYLAAFSLPIAASHVYLLRYDPELLERRLRNRETVNEQKWLIRVFALLFVAASPLPGLDHRFGWSRQWAGVVPAWLALLCDALVAGGFAFVFWVLKVNSFAGRTITVDAGQRVIASGPYAWVRHPMYLGAIVLWSFTPLALGSWVSAPAFVLLIPFYVIRLLNEEKVLRAELPGYPDYCLKTRHHLIPFLW